MHFDSKAFLLRKTRAKATSGDRMLFKMVFSSVERVRLQGGVVAPMYENVGQGRQTPPSPTPSYLSTAISHSRHFSPNVKHYHFWRSVFVTKIRGKIWQEIFPHHHPQWPEFVSQHSEDGLPEDSKSNWIASQRTQNSTRWSPKCLSHLS